MSLLPQYSPASQPSFAGASTLPVWLLPLGFCRHHTPAPSSCFPIWFSTPSAPSRERSHWSYYSHLCTSGRKRIACHTPCSGNRGLARTTACYTEGWFLEGRKACSETQPTKSCSTGAGKAPGSERKASQSPWGGCHKISKGRRKAGTGAPMQRAQLGHRLSITRGEFAESGKATQPLQDLEADDVQRQSDILFMPYE